VFFTGDPTLLDLNEPANIINKYAVFSKDEYLVLCSVACFQASWKLKTNAATLKNCKSSRGFVNRLHRCCKANVGKRLWSLRCWPFVHPSRGPSSITRTDVVSEVGPIFTVLVDVMKPVYNFHPKYRITM